MFIIIKFDFIYIYVISWVKYLAITANDRTRFSVDVCVMHYMFFVFSEPHSGFRIAFNMFDTDGNQIVDKKEFLVVSIVLPLTISLSVLDIQIRL